MEFSEIKSRSLDAFIRMFSCSGIDPRGWTYTDK